MLISPNADLLSPDTGCILFGNSTGGQGLSASNALPAYALNPQSFTFCVWVHMLTASPDGGFFFGLGGSGLGVGAEVDGSTVFSINADGTGTDFGPSVVKGHWYFFAAVGSGTNLTAFVRQANGDFSSLLVTNTVSTGSGATMVLGNSFNINFGFDNGNMSDAQFYSYPKSQAELILQSTQRQPISARGLRSYLPLRNIGNMTKDLVNGHVWTQNGTKANYKNQRNAPPVPEVIRQKPRIFFT